MICLVSLDWNIFKEGKLSPEKYARLRELIPDLPEVMPNDHYWTSHKADIFALAKLGVKFTVEEKAESAFLGAIIDRLDKLQRKIEQLKYSQEQELNERCSVHVPGFSLLEIKQAIVIEDCCTVELNRHLARGWQILAVCPQPDQRRPDYVLGHKSANVDD